MAQKHQRATRPPRPRDTVRIVVVGGEYKAEREKVQAANPGRQIVRVVTRKVGRPVQFARPWISPVPKYREPAIVRTFVLA